MIYICIPTHNEAPTVGVLLWRIRKVFQEYSREYEVIIYDDGSTDGTIEVLEPYAEVIPLTVLRGEKRLGYGNAINTLTREAVKRSRYPRRDCLVIMQADFTDQPETLPDMIKKFEGGTDIVVGERERSASDPVEIRRMRLLSGLAANSRLKTPNISGLNDLFSGYVLCRVSLAKDFLSSSGNSKIVHTDGWAANIELLSKLSKTARRVDGVGVKPRYDLRPRTSRIRPLSDAIQLFRSTRKIPAAPAATRSSSHN